MSASHEWDEWHLTPRGWEAGTERLDFGGGTERPAPSDRVLTVSLHERWSSIHSKGPKYYIEENWRGSDAKEINRLAEQFGLLPKAAEQYRRDF